MVLYNNMLFIFYLQTARLCKIKNLNTSHTHWDGYCYSGSVNLPEHHVEALELLLTTLLLYLINQNVWNNPYDKEPSQSIPFNQIDHLIELWFGKQLKAFRELGVCPFLWRSFCELRLFGVITSKWLAAVVQDTGESR